eukprot:COSAG04_NODE_20127_length_400_cov_0.687708_1_plen_103_part_01
MTLSDWSPRHELCARQRELRREHLAVARMAASGSGSALPGSVDVVEEWSTLVSGGDADASDNAGSPSALLMLRSAVAKSSHLRSASKYLSSQLQAKRQAANAA